MRGHLKGSEPDWEAAFVREIGEMAFDRGGVAVAIAPGQDMNRQGCEWQVDEDGGPSDIWRADPKQHRDSKDHHPRIERRPEQYARGHRGNGAGGFARAAIQGCVE